MPRCAGESPRRVFVNSMSDLFHPQVPFDFVTEVFDVMCTAAARHGHIFQVLTKAAGSRAVAWWVRNQDRYGRRCGRPAFGSARRLRTRSTLPVSPYSRACRHRLGSSRPSRCSVAVDLSEWLRRGDLQWVIAGGESGRAARPMDIDWARDLRDQSIDAGVARLSQAVGRKAR